MLYIKRKKGPFVRDIWRCGKKALQLREICKYIPVVAKAIHFLRYPKDMLFEEAMLLSDIIDAMSNLAAKCPSPCGLCFFVAAVNLTYRGTPRRGILYNVQPRRMQDANIKNIEPIAASLTAVCCRKPRGGPLPFTQMRECLPCAILFAGIPAPVVCR